MQFQQIAAVSLLAGSFFFAGPPVDRPPEVPPGIKQAAVERPEPPRVPTPPAAPKNEPSPQKTATAPVSKADPRPAVPKKAIRSPRPKAKTAVPKARTYCEALRRRMARTPNRVFSCPEMKAARRCERPGDRAKASPAQIAKGWECYWNGQL